MSMDVIRSTVISELEGMPVNTDNIYFDAIINNWLLPLTKKYEMVKDWKVSWIDNPLKKYIISDYDSTDRMIAYSSSELGELEDQLTDKDVVLIICDNYGNIPGKTLEYDSQMYLMCVMGFVPIEFFFNEKRIEVLPMLYLGTKAGRKLLRVFRTATLKNVATMYTTA